eukprot:s9471_g1.t1
MAMSCKTDEMEEVEVDDGYGVETDDWWQPGVKASWHSRDEDWTAEELKEEEWKEEDWKTEQRDDNWAWEGWTKKEDGWQTKEEKGWKQEGGWQPPRAWAGTWKYKRAGDTNWTTGAKRIKTAWGDEEEERSTTAE